MKKMRREWTLSVALAATCAMSSQPVGAAPNCADLTGNDIRRVAT
jgi:hypothetical protein